MKITKEMNNKGITLIALVITIIIMLILVGVTISMAVNGGLFDYAGKAVGDMDNALALEQELSNGRIKIGGVWYDSINDFVQGIVSGDQTEDEIIITGEYRETADGKYIDLSFQIAGKPGFEEYFENEYKTKYLPNFVNYNVYPKETIDDMELRLKDIVGNDNGVFGDDEVVITDELKNNVIAFSEAFFENFLGQKITLPYEQSLRIYLYCMYNQSNIEDAGNELMYTIMVDNIYGYVCEIYGVEQCYEGTEVEKQVLELMNYEGSIDKYLESIGTSKKTLQEEAEESDMLSYGFLLKFECFLSDKLSDLLVVNVAVSNGESFEADFSGYSYKVPEEGTYTFTATMADGRKGEATIVAKSWVMAWEYGNETWSELEKGATAQGDIVVKFFETGETITPDNSSLVEAGFGQELCESGPAYRMVVEGTGLLAGEDEAFFGPWYTEEDRKNGSYVGHYVTDVSVSEGILAIPDYMFWLFVSLEDVELASSVTAIGDNGFNSCVKLDEAEVTEILKSVTEVGSGAFGNCKALRHITIPKNIETLEPSAFMETGIESVTFEEGITKIWEEAFYSIIGEHDKLKEINIPSTVTIIEDRAFAGLGALESIVIPEGVTTIGRYAFGNCTKLSSITLPSTITSIEEMAFMLQNNNGVVFYVPNETVETLVKQYLESDGLSDLNYTVEVK